jgi:hypothetical protein
MRWISAQLERSGEVGWGAEDNGAVKGKNRFGQTETSNLLLDCGLAQDAAQRLAAAAMLVSLASFGYSFD